MGRVKGSALMTIQACEEQALRGHITSAAAGKTNLNVDQLVDLLCTTFPQTYARRSRKLLTERVAKINLLPFSLSQPQPKRQRKLSQAPAVNTEEDDESQDSEGNSDESGDGSEESSKDVNEINPPISRDLGRSDELGGVRRYMKTNGDDVNGNNRPVFRDFVGSRSVIDDLTWEVIVPLRQLEVLHHLGVEPTTRILLHGPPGCGKTLLARALANEAGLPLYEVSAADLMSGVSGAPEEDIRELFSIANSRAPSIVFIDEIDAVTSRKEKLQKEIDPRIVNQLMACMDEPNRLIKPVKHDAGSESSNNRPGYVLVIGATNRPDALDPALRQRFDREIVIDAPDENGRNRILSRLIQNLKVEDRFKLLKIDRCTLGFVGGDLVELVKKAGIHALKRITDKRKYKKQGDGAQFDDYYRKPFSNEEMKNVSLTMDDFVEAAKMVQPSSRLEGLSTTPNANWDDVGGLQLLKFEFERHIVKRIKFPEVYKDLGVDIMTTFFLYGPSGCGKTLIVEALANEAGANFLHVKGPQLLQYRDHIELMVCIISNYAKAHPPCIVFFDELEAVIRGDDEGIYADIEELVVDDEKSCGVYVIVATNRPEVVSYLSKDARLESFDMIMHVPLPRPEERGEILKALARNKPIDAHVDLMALGKNVACKNFSGADLSELMTEAIRAAFDPQTLFGGGCRVPWTVKEAHFNGELADHSPTISSTEVKQWELVPAECQATLEW